MAAVGRRHRAGGAAGRCATRARLPVAVRGALMPDAHQGYGLPIGGVLATENAVIPYAVGVDIACRMKLSVFDIPARTLERLHPSASSSALERETAFGTGADARAAARARRAGRGLVATPRHHAAARTARGGPARHERLGQPLRRVRHAHARSNRTSASPPGRTSPCSPPRQPRHGRDGRRALLASWPRTLHPELPPELELPRVARPRSRGRPGVLGRDEPDGPVRRRQPRGDPPAACAGRSARRCSPASRTTTTSRGRSTAAGR